MPTSDAAPLHPSCVRIDDILTGQPIGGVAPVGHPAPIRTLIDEDLGAYPEIWAAGGIPHAVFPLTFPQLVALTSGSIARVA